MPLANLRVCDCGRLSISREGAAASDVSLMKDIKLVKDFDEDRGLGGLHTVPSGC